MVGIRGGGGVSLPLFLCGDNKKNKPDRVQPTRSETSIVTHFQHYVKQKIVKFLLTLNPELFTKS